MYQVTSLKEIEKAINENGDVVVRKNNENSFIVMSIEEYDKAELITSLKEMEEEIENGEDADADEVFKVLREKYKY